MARRVETARTTSAIHIGLPGPIAATKLLRLSGRIGLGESARFLRRQAAGWAGWCSPHAYRPHDLLARSPPTSPARRTASPGLHVFTFNEIERAERWRSETIARFESQGA